jgi:hypothetical protein
MYVLFGLVALSFIMPIIGLGALNPLNLVIARPALGIMRVLFGV